MQYTTSGRFVGSILMGWLLLSPGLAAAQQPTLSPAEELELRQLLEQKFGNASFVSEGDLPEPPADVPDPANSAPLDPNLLQLVEEIEDNRDLCLDSYRLNSVAFMFPESNTSAVAAGETISLSGLLKNENAFPLTGGKVLAVVRREDTAVGPNNWYPLVAEMELPGDYSLPSTGERSFDFHWDVPASSPAGLYHAEFFYVAGGKYSLSGLSFVPNFPGGTTLFSVVNDNESQLVEFDRASVRLNGEPLSLRYIPKRVPEDSSQVSVEADLVGAQNVSGQEMTVRVALFSWSHTDGSPAIIQEERRVSVSAGERVPIRFDWNDVAPGVYEVFFEATAADSSLLPSLLKVRFPVNGSVPRVIFSGITGFEGEDAIITTCVTNATFGDQPGSFEVNVTTDGSEPTRVVQSLFSSELATSIARVPIASLKDNLSVSVEAKDHNGVVVDQNAFSYDAKILLAEEIKNAKRVRVLLLMLLGAVVLGVVWVLWRLFQTLRRPTMTTFSSASLSSFLVMVGVWAMAWAVLPTNTTQAQTSCSGPFCTNISTWVVGEVHGFAGALNSIMYLRSYIVPTAILTNNRESTLITKGASSMIIPISHSGEVVGNAVAYYDTPPVYFYDWGKVIGYTAGLPVCKAENKVRAQGIVPSCSNYGSYNGEKLIYGTWFDSWNVYKNGVESSDIFCYPSNDPSYGYCKVVPDLRGTYTIVLKRTAYNFHWSGEFAHRGGGHSTMTSHATVFFAPPIATIAPIPSIACSDGKDNDNDQKIDSADSGCWKNPNVPSTYDPKDPSENAAPLAAVISKQVFLGERVTVDGSASRDVDGTIVNYAWQILDPKGKSVPVGGNAIETFPGNVEGTYKIRLTVTDDKGEKASATTSVLVFNNPPVAVINKLSGVVRNTQVTVNGTKSFDPDAPKDRVVSYNWVVKNSSGATLDVQNANQAIATFTPPDEATYVIRLTVTDSKGKTGTATASLNVTQPGIDLGPFQETD